MLLSLHSRWQLSRNGLNIFVQTVEPMTSIDLPLQPSSLTTGKILLNSITYSFTYLPLHCMVAAVNLFSTAILCYVMQLKYIWS